MKIFQPAATSSTTITGSGTSGQVAYFNGTQTITSSANFLFAGTGASLVANGAASTPILTGTGTWFTGGTATTTKPYFLIEPTGTTSTGWSTSGTGLGINAASGFVGRLIDAQLNGTSRFYVTSNATTASMTVSGNGSGSATITALANATSTMSAGPFNGDWTIGNLYIDANTPSITMNTYASIVAGSMASTRNALSVTGTLSSTVATQKGVDIQITGAGSGAQTIEGFNIDLLAGYSGTNTSIGFRVANVSTGTGANAPAGLSSANYGGILGALGTTTGDNVGAGANAANGNRNYAFLGIAQTLKNSATNIGVAGFGLNTGTSPIQIGGFFGLMSSTPTYASAALMADNGSQTSDIFVARDNGTAVFTIADGGKTTTTARFEQSKGANIAAANDLTLGADGNAFTITGNTQINAITTANWQAGSLITLIFTGTPTVKNNTAGSAGTAVMLLAGSADLTAANNTVLGLVYDGTQWQECFRKVA